MSSPALDDALRSKEQAALDIAVEALRNIMRDGERLASMIDVHACAAHALDRIAVLREAKE